MNSKKKKKKATASSTCHEGRGAKRRGTLRGGRQSARPLQISRLRDEDVEPKCNLKVLGAGGVGWAGSYKHPRAYSLRSEAG